MVSGRTSIVQARTVRNAEYNPHVADQCYAFKFVRFKYIHIQQQ